MGSRTPNTWAIFYCFSRSLGGIHMECLHCRWQHYLLFTLPAPDFYFLKEIFLIQNWSMYIPPFYERICIRNWLKINRRNSTSGMGHWLISESEKMSSRIMTHPLSLITWMWRKRRTWFVKWFCTTINLLLVLFSLNFVKCPSLFPLMYI